MAERASIKISGDVPDEILRTGTVAGLTPHLSSQSQSDLRQSEVPPISQDDFQTLLSGFVAELKQGDVEGLTPEQRGLAQRLGTFDRFGTLKALMAAFVDPRERPREFSHADHLHNARIVRAIGCCAGVGALLQQSELNELGPKIISAMRSLTGLSNYLFSRPEGISTTGLSTDSALLAFMQCDMLAGALEKLGAHKMTATLLEPHADDMLEILIGAQFPPTQLQVARLFSKIASSDAGKAALCEQQPAIIDGFLERSISPGALVILGRTPGSDMAEELLKRLMRCTTQQCAMRLDGQIARVCAELLPECGEKIVEYICESESDTLRERAIQVLAYYDPEQTAARHLSSDLSSRMSEVLCQAFNEDRVSSIYSGTLALCRLTGPERLFQTLEWLERLREQTTQADDPELQAYFRRTLKAALTILAERELHFDDQLREFNPSLGVSLGLSFGTEAERGKFYENPVVRKILEQLNQHEIKDGLQLQQGIDRLREENNVLGPLGSSLEVFRDRVAFRERFAGLPTAIEYELRTIVRKDDLHALVAVCLERTANVIERSLTLTRETLSALPTPGEIQGASTFSQREIPYQIQNGLQYFVLCSGSEIQVDAELAQNVCLMLDPRRSTFLVGMAERLNFVGESPELRTKKKARDSDGPLLTIDNAEAYTIDDKLCDGPEVVALSEKAVRLSTDGVAENRPGMIAEVSQGMQPGSIRIHNVGTSDLLIRLD